MKIPKSPGVYRVVNTTDGRHYIGSSQNMHERRIGHFSDLRLGNHSNIKMQRAWNKYGSDIFRFEVVEETSLEAQVEREQFYLDTTNPYYNILKTAFSTKGYKHSPEEIAAACSRQKARWEAMTPEQQAAQKTKLSASKVGQKGMSEATRKRMSAAKTGVVKSQEWRDNLSKAKGQSYLVKSPEGVEFEVSGLKRFCDANGLSQGTLSMVIAGKRTHHKSWTARHAPETKNP